MNESVGAQQSVNTSEKNENNRYLGVCVSFIALLEIATTWRSFGWLNKFIAIGFFSLLLSSAASEFTGRRKGFQFLARNPVSFGGYILIMLAILVFGSR